MVFLIIFNNFARSKYAHMFTFIISVILLILGYIFYGKFVEKVFEIDSNAKTPALTKTDGIDFVPMKPIKMFLIQFLNIAGLGPIFGAIMGIMYGPAAFLWIVFGTIFAGGLHDYMCGMMSVKLGGISTPDVIGSQLGKFIKLLMRIISIVLLVLLATSFLDGVSVLLQNTLALPTLTIKGATRPALWLGIILVYFLLATVMPVDKIIGRLYPIFGGVLLFMGLGIMVTMLISHGADMPEITDGLQNRHPKLLPIFPMMFVTIACGAISGFHATQSPLMSRCMTNEKQGRLIFYGAMVAEGILALIWAAAAGSFFADPEKGLYGIEGLKAFAAQHPGENIAALVVDKICRSWLGVIGGVLALVGVIFAPITSGDTALRSARLIVADFLKLDQKNIGNRLLIAIPLFIAVVGMLFVNFDSVWRYFSWTNQTLAMFALWAGAVFIYDKEYSKTNIDHKYRYGYLIALVPAIFMTLVSVSYILIAPEGLNLRNLGVSWIGYIVAGIVVSACLILFFEQGVRKISK